MKKNSKKCKACGMVNVPLISLYYRGKRGRVSFIKKREEPIYVPRKRCAFCDEIL